MKLDDRLQAMANFVPEGSRAADIGTDHGYLAAALAKSGRSPFVVASDLNRGPYEAAQRTIAEQTLKGKVEVRLGDGLAPLKPGEVETVCIGGMGGVLMTQILGAQPKVAKKLTTLVLQPMNGAYELRNWLYRHYWHITDEALVVSDGRLYEVIQAMRGREKMPEPVLREIGPVLWEKKPPLLKQHIEALLFQHRRIAAGMEKSEEATASRKYTQEKKRICELEEHLTW